MRTKDGTELGATTPEGLVAELHERSRSPAANDEVFMAETAKRVYEQTGVVITTTSKAGFIAALIELGLLIDDDPPRDHNEGEQRDA